MARGKQTVEDKQDILRDILRILQIPEESGFFSRGATVTAKGLEVIRDELKNLKQSGKLKN